MLLYKKFLYKQMNRNLFQFMRG